MKKITVKWMWHCKYGDFKDGENTIDVPEGTAMKDKVLEFFRSPDFTYNDAGAHADGVNFNVYGMTTASGTKPEFLFGGSYECHEIYWDDREVPLDL